MGIRLGFHYHIPARLVDGQIAMPGYQGVFIDSLAANCEKVICFLHSPTRDEDFHGDYLIKAANVELVDIGPHTSVPHRALFAQRFVHPLMTRGSELDIILLRGPSPLFPAMANAAGSLPIALLLVGDYSAGVDDLPQPEWRKWLIRLWSTWNQTQQLAVAKRSLTFVNSHKLFEELLPFVPHLVETRTTTLRQGDFFYREDTCQQPPYHILYTGRMDRGKGLMEMVEALAVLVEEGYDCVLDLVGMEVQGDPILRDIQHKAAELGITGRVRFHGYKPLGEELAAFYHQADVYVIASKLSEGFPRTIWEAMANGLPVVATRVGSIPAFIEGSAELVEPGSHLALVQGIRSMLGNSEKRQSYIRNGYQIAQQNTLEYRSREVISHIKTYLNIENE